jgi:hypothetical protein
VSTRGYTLLGWIVWRLGTWLARRKVRQNRGRLAAAATIVAVVLVGLALARGSADE